MNQGRNIKILAVILVFGAVTLACGFSLDTNDTNTETPLAASTSVALQVAPSQPLEPKTLVLQQPTRVSKPLIVTSEEQILVEMYQRINPSVVNVITYQGQGDILTPSGQGSGFMYDEKGDIVTNSHVVHGSDQVEVVFSNGFSESAKVLGEDLNSDLAVIQVSNFPGEALPLPLGNIDEVAVGQTAVALGNPFGLGGTLTRGIVSALGRTIPALTQFSIPQAIQTDAPINPGNSGGPLLNLAGEVIGVNAQIETGGTSRSNSGVGFAIPVSIVARVVPELIQNGHYDWSWLGVVGGDLNSAMRKAMNLSVEQGAYVSEVVQGGPAEKAGLKGSSKQATVDNRVVEVGGDVIVGIDGSQVSSFEDILIYIALNTEPGQKVNLTILRDGKTQEIPLTLELRPTGADEFASPTVQP